MEQEYRSEENPVLEDDEAPMTPMSVEADQDEPQAGDDDWED